MKVGSIVRCRNRDWVLLASESDDVWVLRPLTGSTDDTVKIHKSLANVIAYSLPFERIDSSAFPLPGVDDISDSVGASLLWNASRLSLRENATPFRSLGRISIRPRVYQFVPLLMALKLNPIRLFIADDVGVGKTIEALLIAKELFERGEIRSFCVLCPPYLCNQWEKEISEKFNLPSVIIRSGTVGQLEKRVVPGRSIYEQFPIQVASIDFIKTERNRRSFLQFCPELIIVDEVHGAAQSLGRNQQERHTLLKEIAKDQNRHLILLTATPHSGVDEAFRSLLGLLNPDFENWNISELTENQRTILARHYVQRTRKDILSTWESIVPFPQRIANDETYELSSNYRNLFDLTYKFCSEIIQTGERLEERKRRVRYWGALALLRCVMSSPASALVAIKNRDSMLSEQEDIEFKPYVFESDQEFTEDETPTPPVEAAESTLEELDRRKLREIANLANRLMNPNEDRKLSKSYEVVNNLLKEGFNPILWCRYVATAEYLANYLREALAPEIPVICITGRMPDDERKTKIEEIDIERPRVLVATDCLSEGINLQDKFNAVIHYDLPWNPNRLEQREGRVDRYGQPSKTVYVVRFFGRDNPIDGVVIDVLLNKAREIHKTLGTYVPVPEEGESVMEALLQALFLRKSNSPYTQLSLDFVPENTDKIQNLHKQWERDVERERINRTKFAQRAIKPEEVYRELEAADNVLGDPNSVKSFVLEASSRLGIIINPHKIKDVFVIDCSQSSIPERLYSTIPKTRNGRWLISFESPTPEGAEYLGRNHPFVSALASYIFEEAMEYKDKATATRCGVIRTKAVNLLTILLLLRVRYLVEQPNAKQLLAEEVRVLGYRRTSKQYIFLSDSEALELLTTAKPDANVPISEKRELIKLELEKLKDWQNGEIWNNSFNFFAEINEKIQNRAKELEESHKRIRSTLDLHIRGFHITPQLPPDLIGLLILQPVVQR